MLLSSFLFKPKKVPYIFSCVAFGYISFYLICRMIWDYYTYRKMYFNINKGVLAAHTKFDDVVIDKFVLNFFFFSKAFSYIHFEKNIHRIFWR